MGGGRAITRATARHGLDPGVEIAINTGGQAWQTTKNLRQGIAGGFGGLASSRLWLLEACLVDTL
jgi:hypothetical protein